jgi:hypothetical protein
VGAVSAASRRLDDLRARRAAHAADRAAFAERRQYGLAGRRAAKLAYLRTRTEEEPEEPDNSILSEQDEPEVA